MSVTMPTILSRLQGVQRAGAGWIAFCPAHEDRHKRSLSIGETGGKILLKCFVGCPVDRIAQALKLQVSDLFSVHHGDPKRSTRDIVATYDYRDEAGTLLYQVCRFDPKDFRPRRPDGKGGWVWGLGHVRRVLYRLPDLAEHDRVLWVEGEKDVERLWALGLPATTSQGGARNFRPDYARQLVDVAVREVIVIPDHDAAGHEYASGVATALTQAGLTVRLLELPGLPERGDVSDWLLAGHTRDELRALADGAPMCVAAAASAAPMCAAAAPSAAPSDALPERTAEGENVRIRWSDSHPLEVLAVAPRESGDGVHAEVTVSLAGAVLSWGRLNLASTAMREGLVKKLRETVPELPWRERLELACRLIVEEVRMGAPLVALRPAPRPGAQRDLIEDVLPLGETSLLYADGDAGKGWVALLIAVALGTGQGFPHLRPMRRGVTTAYLDWESTEEEVAARVDGICRGLGVDLPPGSILYRPMYRALADEAPRVRADFARHGVSVVILDSFGPAAGAEPESADSTIRVMNALRSFTDTTRLVLAHVSKAAADQPTGATRPYGSVFVRNLARSAWELRRAEETEPDELLVAAYHRKNNGGRRAPAFGLRLRFDPDGAVLVTGADLAEAPDLLARTSVSKRVTVALAAGALTVAELAEHLSAPETTVGRIVRRLREKGHVVPVGDARPHRWGLAAR
ncbi:MAG: AAA family ATPase [Candidatus Rokuibacteriota bacterium]